MKTILETTNVTKIYDSNGLVVKAVDDVSLSVKAGEFIGLVGPSGSGKTTMLAMLATLLRESQGSLKIDGEDLGKMSDKERTKFRRERIGRTSSPNRASNRNTTGSGSGKMTSEVFMATVSPGVRAK